VTAQRLQAIVGPQPVVGRIEHPDSGHWREPTIQKRTVSAGLRRFIQRRGCTPAGSHPVHRVRVAFFRPLSN